MEENKNLLGQEIQSIDSLYEHYAVTADRGQSHLRVDKFLMSRIENVTRNRIQQSAKEGSIYVNDLIVRSNYKVKGGDKVSVVYSYPQTEYELIPQDIPINIVYEDDDLLIVNKEAGMVVHPGFGNYDGTLVNALAYHFKNLPNMSDENRPGLVHRIDKNTSTSSKLKPISRQRLINFALSKSA